jgi:unsaturated chondroitin disaccharide hydrolase
VLLIATASAAQTPGFDTSDADRVLSVARQQLARTALVVPTNYSPKSVPNGGTWTTVANTDLIGWTQGFFPGSLWLMHQATGEAIWRTHAEAWTRPLELQKTNTQTHDLGFKFMPSFGHAYLLTGDPAYRSVLLTAARSLATRFNSTVGIIDCCDWNPAWQVPLVTDTMVNLELLFWASRNGGEAAWNDMALRHALKTMTDMVRPDGSTFHVVDYDSAGRIRSRGTFQGYSASSTWARGHAWAIYGFTMAYRYTRDPRMLQTAQRVTNYYLGRLPADGIPFWDFDAPASQQVKDSSTAAIVASALLELSTFVTDPADQTRYRDAALRMLDVLASPAYLASGTSTYAILQHGVGHYPAGQEIDVGLIYGDYYLLEAIVRFKGLVPPLQAISFGGTWRYDDRGVDPGAQWRTLAFDDSGWKSGTGQFGYGDGDEATVLTRTSPAQPSVYFRKRLSLSGPVTRAELRALHDDGIAVWVNGSLVFSRHVANGTGHAAYASATSQDNELSSAVIPASAFVAGENIVAVMVKQSSATSSDVSFDLALTLTLGGSTPPPEETVVPIPSGSVWKYDDTGTDRGTAWLALGYDDTAWSSGSAQLGYGDGDEATVLRSTPIVPSYYFRRRFRVEGQVTQAQLRAVFDDGVAVWVNGTRVFSRNVGNGTAFGAFASASGENTVADVPLDLTQNPFVPGDNVVTVMVKQVSTSSSDVSFDLSLTLRVRR